MITCSIHIVRLSITSILIGFTLIVFGQSDNYWSWNFNTPSTLLAGAVVGGNAGPSAMFYNPALIDHENIPTLSLSANILSLQFYDVKNVAGDGIDADKFIFKVQPRFVSYTLPTKSDRFGVEVAILSPVSDEFRFTTQHMAEIDIIKRTLGNEMYSGYLKYNRKFNDTWAGGGFSYMISDNFFVGVSSFLSVKVMNYYYQQTALAYHKTDSVMTSEGPEAKYIASSYFEEELKYWFLSFIFKAGAQFKTNSQRFSAGFNLTFPDIPIYGEADVRKQVGRSNVYNNAEGRFVSNENTLQVEEKTRVRVKNPFSIAVGAQYSTENRKNSILFTVEYFSKIDTYAVVDSDLPPPEWLPGHIIENISDFDFMSFYFEANSVTNAAIGWKQYISPSLFFLGGFRTDFTASDKEDTRYVSNKYTINQVNIDKYHITAGAVLRIKRFRVISGLQYTRGRNSGLPEMVNYADPIEYNPLTDQALEGVKQNNTEAILNEIALFFGLTVDFDVKQN